MYSCKILADSTSPTGDRLTTFEVCFPRMVLADITRHRALSFSVESTRARPTESIIDQVKNSPVIPVFLERTPGMGGGEPLRGMARTRAQCEWLGARDDAVTRAAKMLNTSKQHVGRMLEPWMWVTAIISGTSWKNFFDLRLAPAAQPELQHIARLMRLRMDCSTPTHLNSGEWHLPLVEADEPEGMQGASISAGRCARVSFLKQTEKEFWRDSELRWIKKLWPEEHWSPAEHPAKALDTHETHPLDLGNFNGFQQLRKHYQNG